VCPKVAIDAHCQRWGGPLRLIALVKSEASIRKILAPMDLPTEVPTLHAPRPPPGSFQAERWPPEAREQLN
jgi:hypothetical protein